MNQKETVDFTKIRIGTKTFSDAALTDYSTFKYGNSNLSDKQKIIRALDRNEVEYMREVSNFFYRTSGIYSRLCRYMAYLYRYDWIVTSYANYTTSEKSKLNTKKILKTFNDILFYLDNFNVKKVLGDIALKVLKNGCHYVYVTRGAEQPVLQDLPPKYCRSRYEINGIPVVEFNMKFFDENFLDQEYRERIVKLFPPDIQKGYKLYKAGKLVPDYRGDDKYWYTLSHGSCFKFNLNDDDLPAFCAVIPSIIDLDNCKGIDRKRMERNLVRLIVQEMPLDKNNDLVFDMEEIAQLHANAVQMVGSGVGVEVLTSPAKVTVEDMSGTSTSANNDELEKVERAVFNEAGVSQMQFNTDGNIALEKSILNDEASMYNLLLQFEVFLNYTIEHFNSNYKKNYFKVQILPTTIYNYKELSKLYKEQASMGYSKILPQLALGQSQSSILANAYFENDILDLVNVFIPLMNSNTMSGDSLMNRDKSGDEDNKGGRPTNEESGKPDSEKTLQNKESQN